MSPSLSLLASEGAVTVPTSGPFRLALSLSDCRHSSLSSLRRAGAAADPSVSATSEPALPIHTHELENGLRVVMCESRGAPVVALQVWVEVGSADERLDQGGLAHVHEHMLFKGTATRGVGAIASEIEAAGGEINAWTSYD